MLVCVFDRESKNQLTFQLTSAHIYCCMKDEWLGREMSGDGKKYGVSAGD